MSIKVNYIDMKNRTYYFFNDIINIKNFKHLYFFEVIKLLSLFEVG